MKRNTRTKLFAMRLLPGEYAALLRLRAAYGLPSTSAAARAAIRQAANDRGLMEPGNSPGEVGQ